MKEKSEIRIEASIVHRDSNGDILEERNVGTSRISLDQFRDKIREE